MLNEIDLSRADLNLLVLFETVLDSRHVGRAAERLNLSPSAVSHGLGRLRRLLNDPLFLRTPKGVVPTARAMELAEPIADALARVRGIVATARPFDPARSTRRFTIGGADGSSAVFLPRLLAALQAGAPFVNISVRQLLPTQAGRTTVRAFEPALAEIEARAMDIGVFPYDEIPPRFVTQVLYEEDFVIAMRARHVLAADCSLHRYCEAPHMLVSATGDPEGFIDQALAAQGRARRVALTVPNFSMALALIAESDAVCALPRRFAALHARRFGMVIREAPLRLPRFRMCAVASRAALRDAGVAWLFELLRESVQEDGGAIGTSAELQRPRRALTRAARAKATARSRR
jgi:DNA-binding transcriptional LysR family regulator